MLIFSRERPTFQNGLYTQLTVHKRLHNLWSEDYKVTGGIHRRYIPESECQECDSYWGDEYEVCSPFELEIRESESHDTFFVVPLTPREDDESQSGTSRADVALRPFADLSVRTNGSCPTPPLPRDPWEDEDEEYDLL